MNHLVIIGNGFDIAHGLKTSYKDFIIWYLNFCIKNVKKSRNGTSYSDELIRLNSEYTISGNLKISDVNLIDKVLKSNRIELNYESEFLVKIMQQFNAYNWVDIEKIYYNTLVEYFSFVNEKRSSLNNVVESVKKLNKDFDYIKHMLIEYLKEINADDVNLNYEIKNHLDKITSQLNIHSKDEILFLNFNYTKTIEKYVDLANDTLKQIQIHGGLNDKLENIVFGYGDETDINYHDIERLEENDFLTHIKMFYYSANSNYLKLISFLNQYMKTYKVHIMGHSCGVSDRVLLKTVFENPNCEKIKIYYHSISKDKNDFREKHMNISRHFSSDKKGDLRTKIEDFESCLPLIPYNQ